MAKSTTDVDNLVINVLTENQYAQALRDGEIDDSQLYLTPEKKLIKSISQSDYDSMKDAGTLDSDILYVTPTEDISDATYSQSGYMSSSDKLKLDNIESGANHYVHPSYTSKSNGFYKITVDATGHVSGTSSVSKSDIIDALGYTPSSQIETDTTLKIPGAAADAATVGNIVLPRLVVKIEYGSSVTITDGMDAKITGTSTSSNTFSTTLPHDGEWTVSATLNTGVATGTVQTAYCQTETLELSYYKLTVSVNAGSIVTVRNGSQTLTKAVPSSGSATVIFYLPNIGTWRVTATLGSESAESSITVDSGHHTYHVRLAYAHIYGASWDGLSGTKWSRTDNSAYFTDPVPYVAGSSSYSSPFDNLQPWAGMVKTTRSIGGTNQSMVAIPKFWYKLAQNGAGMAVQICNKNQDGFSVSPAHMDRGDGYGERDVVYVGRYHCNSSYGSNTGHTPLTGLTRVAARVNIHNLGSTVWQCDFAMRFTIWLLYIVEFADWDSQSVIGRGGGTTNITTTTHVGYTDSMPYHTGTTASDRKFQCFGTQYRNIEGLWDNVYDWLDGCYYNSKGLSLIINPNKFDDHDNGTVVGVPVSGYPSGFTIKTGGPYPVFIPSSSNGTSSTYSCDIWQYSSTFPNLSAGGTYAGTSAFGMFCIACNTTTANNSTTGCRIQELPN